MWIVDTIMNKTKIFFFVRLEKQMEMNFKKQNYCRLQVFVLFFGWQVLFQDGSLVIVRSRILHRVYFLHFNIYNI